MFANQGVIRCYGFDPNFAPGAHPEGESRLSGLACVAEGERARARRRVDDQSRGGRGERREPGALVAYDMNHDSSWRADGEPALDSRRRGRRATRARHERIEFRYFPRTLACVASAVSRDARACLWRRRYAPRRSERVGASLRFRPFQRFLMRPKSGPRAGLDAEPVAGASFHALGYRPAARWLDPFDPSRRGFYRNFSPAFGSGACGS